MFQVKNFTDNDDVKILDQKGAFTVLEYQRDLSVTPGSAITAYYCSQMNVRKRQVMCDVSKSNITLQAGAMQWMLGDVNATTGIKGVGDLFGKAVRGKVSGESAIKPEYTGTGLLVLEPTYKYLILMDAADWGGSVVLDDGLFLACDSRLKHKAVMRSNVSSAVAGGEGLFNLSLNGSGVFCIESECPQEELIEVTLENDVLKIDGNYAIAWSGSLNFSVERSGKSLIGSAASGEGLVNVYRGTGKVLMMPTAKMPNI
ncbi:MAG TPA: AIM24 family protein [Candidatus Anaerobutyricum avicola]|nr:AIM24 family protein [Candidatus Anaerobutyricum avicola]